MELCPSCQTGLFLKQVIEEEAGTVTVKTCRNPNCGNYQAEVARDLIMHTEGLED